MASEFNVYMNDLTLELADLESITNTHDQKSTDINNTTNGDTNDLASKRSASAKDFTSGHERRDTAKSMSLKENLSVLRLGSLTPATNGNYKRFNELDQVVNSS